MDRQATKKAIERRRVEDLRSLWPSFPPGILEDAEPPDFLLHTGSDVIGLEVTGLYLAGGEEARRTEGAWRTLLDAAQRRYEGAGSPPVQVIAYWRTSPPMAQRAREDWQLTLAAAVHEIVMRGGDYARVERARRRGVELPPGLERLSVHRVHDPSEAFWSFGQGGVVPSWTPEFLQAKIAEKERKVASYVHLCDRAWLILVAEHDYASSWGQHSDESRGFTYTTCFERVVVYRTMAAEVFELRVRAPGTDGACEQRSASPDV